MFAEFCIPQTLYIPNAMNHNKPNIYLQHAKMSPFNIKLSHPLRLDYPAIFYHHHDGQPVYCD